MAYTVTSSIFMGPMLFAHYAPLFPRPFAVAQLILDVSRWRPSARSIFWRRRRPPAKTIFRTYNLPVIQYSPCPILPSVGIDLPGWCGIFSHGILHFLILRLSCYLSRTQEWEGILEVQRNQATPEES